MIKTILQSSALLLVANILGRLTLFLSHFLAARILTLETFGQYAMLKSTVAMIGEVVTTASGSTGVKRIAEVNSYATKKVPEIITSIFIVNLLLVMVVIVIVLLNYTYIINNFFYPTPFITNGLYISLIWLLVFTLSATMVSMFIGFEFYRKLAVLGLFVSLVSIPIIYIVISKYGFYGAMFGIIFYYIFDFSVKVMWLTKQIPLLSLNLKKVIHQIKFFWGVSYPLFISVVLSSFSFWYARTLIVNKNQGYSELAIYDASYQWLGIIMIITGATTSIALPMLSKRRIDAKSDSLNILYVNLIVNSLISVTIVLIFITFSKELMSIYGDKYIVGHKILGILSVTSIFWSVSSLFNKFLISRDKSWLIFLTVSVSTIVMFYTLNHNIEAKIYALAFSTLSFYVTSALVYFFIVLYEIRTIVK